MLQCTLLFLHCNLYYHSEWKKKKKTNILRTSSGVSSHRNAYGLLTHIHECMKIEMTIRICTSNGVSKISFSTEMEFEIAGTQIWRTINCIFCTQIHTGRNCTLNFYTHAFIPTRHTAQKWYIDNNFKRKCNELVLCSFI